ncbi:hypothetical protein HELRODRAFT_171835 [Helobdella robusta]|uniref:Uncharacterized protein n=1 Tax=Helobdella robusta TaxID=6412 RepID=T1F4R8_HELRO|nr:hypothetical protein HELRODRAFT_171835 [Helobdella robusta]ESO05434.1 hypothetical protein HELRODRAFT_171835 [Helobdella robusta]
MWLVAKNSSLLSPDLTLIILHIALRNLRVLGYIGPRTSIHIGKNSIEGRAFPYFAYDIRRQNNIATVLSTGEEHAKFIERNKSTATKLKTTKQNTATTTTYNNINNNKSISGNNNKSNRDSRNRQTRTQEHMNTKNMNK